MEQLKVIEFLEQNKEFLFPNTEYNEIEVENALTAVPDEFEMTMRSIPFRKPKTLKIISFFVGSIGVDRFYLGDIKNGIIKYFTFGGIGIWWIKDIISAENRCRTYNCQKLMAAITDPSVIAQMQSIDDKISGAVSFAKKAAPVAQEAVKGFKTLQDDMMP